MAEEIHRRYSLGSCSKLFTTFESFLTGKRGDLDVVFVLVLVLVLVLVPVLVLALVGVAFSPY